MRPNWSNSATKNVKKIVFSGVPDINVIFVSLFHTLVCLTIKVPSLPTSLQGKSVANQALRSQR